MFVKLHQIRGNKVAAICDEDLIGKKFTKKNIVIYVSEHFYKGDIMKDEEVVLIMKKFSNLNLVGKKTIALALQHEIILSEGVLKVKGVPYAQVIEY